MRNDAFLGLRGGSKPGPEAQNPGFRGENRVFRAENRVFRGSGRSDFGGSGRSILGVPEGPKTSFWGSSLENGVQKGSKSGSKKSLFWGVRFWGQNLGRKIDKFCHFLGSRIWGPENCQILVKKMAKFWVRKWQNSGCQNLGQKFGKNLSIFVSDFCEFCGIFVIFGVRISGFY